MASSAHTPLVNECEWHGTSQCKHCSKCDSCLCTHVQAVSLWYGWGKWIWGGCQRWLPQDSPVFLLCGILGTSPYSMVSLGSGIKHPGVWNSAWSLIGPQEVLGKSGSLHFLIFQMGVIVSTPSGLLSGLNKVIHTFFTKLLSQSKYKVNGSCHYGDPTKDKMPGCIVLLSVLTYILWCRDVLCLFLSSQPILTPMWFTNRPVFSYSKIFLSHFVYLPSIYPWPYTTFREEEKGERGGSLKISWVRYKGSGTVWGWGGVQVVFCGAYKHGHEFAHIRLWAHACTQWSTREVQASRCEGTAHPMCS